MPQLDTIYILTIFLWAWFIMLMLVQKIKTFMMVKAPKIATEPKTKKTTQNLPWT